VRCSRCTPLVAGAMVAAVLLLLLGCTEQRASHAPSTPVLGLHSYDSTVTVGQVQYRLTPTFSDVAGRSDIERLAVRLDWASSSPATRRGLDATIAAFGADGSARVEPAGYSPPSDVSASFESTGDRSSGYELAAFSVHKGESGVVVQVEVDGQPDARWLAR